MRPITQSRKRFLLTGGALVLSLALSFTIFFALRHLEDENAQATFRSAAAGRLDAVEMNIRQTLDNIAALGGFFDASHERWSATSLRVSPPACWTTSPPSKPWHGFQECRSPFERHTKRRLARRDCIRSKLPINLLGDKSGEPASGRSISRYFLSSQ